jgi:hypothetical protein
LLSKRYATSKRSLSNLSTMIAQRLLSDCAAITLRLLRDFGMIAVRLCSDCATIAQQLLSDDLAIVNGLRSMQRLRSEYLTIAL